MTQLEERLLWIALLAALVIGFGWYEQERGKAKCELSDAQVVAVQKAATEAQEATDAKRLKEAKDAYQAELSKLAVPQPTDHLVCHAASPRPVPIASGVRAAHPAGAGPLPQPGPSTAQSFDPGPGLDRLFDEADAIVARCRELDNSVPHEDSK